MGASPTPKSAERSARRPSGPALKHHLSRATSGGQPLIAVATSGGRDSTALLHCTLRHASPLGVRVLALHVHHGLQAQADDWQATVQAQARRWGAEFAVTRLQGAPAVGDSIEAWARRGRYAALAQMAAERQCLCVLLAHHRLDQAETWLLQALRGAGAAGLAAMPEAAHRQGLVWARPWLQQPRAAIDAYVRRHRLSFVDDPSNNDTRLARNRLRLQVWPALQQAFPDAETVLAAASAQAQHALALATEVAALDMQSVADPAGLNIGQWSALGVARQKNVLKFWLRQQRAAAVPESLLQRLMLELHRCKQGRWPLHTGPDDGAGKQGGFLHLYRGFLSWRTAAGAPTRQQAAAPSPRQIDLQRPGRYRLPEWCGHFEVREASECGLSPMLLQGLWAKPRQGGEQFALAPRATARSLAKQFQARAVPPWQRVGPLLWTADGRLLFVPGLGLNAAVMAAAPAKAAPQRAAGGLMLTWVPDGSATDVAGP